MSYLNKKFSLFDTFEIIENSQDLVENFTSNTSDLNKLIIPNALNAYDFQISFRGGNVLENSKFRVFRSY